MNGQKKSKPACIDFNRFNTFFNQLEFVWNQLLRMSHIENKAKLNGNHILVNIQNRIKILDGHLKQVHKTYLTFFSFFLYYAYYVNY